MRTFDTGATRDNDDGKLEHWGFSSALVEKRYSEYMHTHRIQADGGLRSSDNWTKGIPVKAYKDSLSRHINDLRLHLEGFPEEAEERDFETVLCAVKFNVDGIIYETVKASLARVSAWTPELEDLKQQMRDCVSGRDEWFPEEDEDRAY